MEGAPGWTAAPLKAVLTFDFCALTHPEILLRREGSQQSTKPSVPTEGLGHGLASQSPSEPITRAGARGMHDLVP